MELSKIININCRCKVKLTKNGAKYLNNFHQEKINETKYIFNALGATSLEINKVYCTTYLEGDTLELPLWELIGKFGRYFEVYTEAAFVNNQIEFIND